ncbi:DUF1853 family protein [Haloferula chungangensis]|uniref:DUF1853 family protein n=1 Tax=Haloferula chungangensis TaxID=1048331 RepID=A0ABW2L1F9_9BACT
MISPTHVLLQSLTQGPLLIGDLPEASSFPYRELALPEDIEDLNLQQKLGHLYEDALASLLEASPRFELLARNLQLQSADQITLGELDFLLRDLASEQLIHLELAAKFYLAVETPSGLALPGPDARDNYFRKLNRLRSHQLPLVENHRSALPEEYRQEDIVAQQLVYGCLFDHIHAALPAKPEFVHPHCRRGRWLSINECPGFFGPEPQLQIIPKPLWPVPLSLIENTPLEPWNPKASIDRCLMLRVNHDPTPYFVTPPVFPSSR